MKVKIEINCDNAAFDPSPIYEVSRILEDLVHRLRREMISSPEKLLMDGNGNTVGKLEWISDEEVDNLT